MKERKKEVEKENKKITHPNSFLLFLFCLAIDVLVELPWSWELASNVDFVLPLAGDPGLNEILGEDVSLGKELVISFEGVDGFLETCGSLWNASEFFSAQGIDVLLEWLSGGHLVLDSINASHKDS